MYNRSFHSIFFLGIMLSSCFVPEKTVTRDYEEFFTGIGEIELEGRFLEVSYEGDENAEQVFLNAYLETAESSGMDIKFRKSGSRLKIEVVGDMNGGWNFGGNQHKGYISLTGPDDIRLNFKSNSGSIDVMHVKNRTIDLKVNSGSIKTMNIEADQINLTASSGSIKGEGFVGNINTQVNSGSINLIEVDGDVEAKGSSGSLKFEKIEGTVNAKVNSGSMRFVEVTGLGDLSVSSGNIRAERSGLSDKTNLNANSGSIRIQTDSDLRDYNYDLSANSGSVRVGESSSGKRLDIGNNAPHTIRGKVSSGSIRIEN